MSRLILTILAFIVGAGTLCACDGFLGNNSIDTSILESEVSGDASEEFSKIGNVVSEYESDYTDTVFEKTMFVKNCDVSEEPNFESVYRFNPDGTMTNSINMYEGFTQSNAQYFIRTYKGIKGYKIWYYYNEKIDFAKVLFSVDKNDKITSDNSAPTSFIDETEFNTIYKFHTDWNEGTLGGYDE